MTSNDGKVLIGVVADGAGSASHSHIGAQIAVRTFLAHLKKVSQVKLNPTETTACFSAGLANVQSAIHAYASKTKRPLQDFATTLLGVMATPFSLHAFQIGDGFIVGRQNSAKYSILFPPHKGVHINETCFITEENALENMNTICLPEPWDFVALSTDGLESVALHAPQIDLQNSSSEDWTASSGFFKPLEEHVRSNISPYQLEKDMSRFLRTPRLKSRSSDDRTLLIGGQITQNNRSSPAKQRQSVNHSSKV